MRLLVIIFLYFVVSGCIEEEKRVAIGKPVFMTLDGQIIPDGEIIQELKNEEERDRFVKYLSDRGIRYRLDDRFHNGIGWVPSSDKHREKILRGFYGIPENQVDQVFENKDQAKKFILILQKMDVEFVHHDEINPHVVLWYPTTDKQKQRIIDLKSEQGL